MEIVIQYMIDSDVSGVAFTKHPITGENKLYLEAVWGLGESLVSGISCGDRILMDSSSIVKEYKVSFQKKRIKV